MNGYDDIINLPHHRSAKREHMSMQGRAAQFASFAALVGHGEAIDEVARQTVQRIELDDYMLEEIGRRLRIIADNISDKPELTVTYFVPDKKKSGGEYVVYTGCIRRIDEETHSLIMMDERKIPICEIYQVECELIKDFQP